MQPENEPKTEGGKEKSVSKIKKLKKKTEKERSKSLLFAADSAIDRLKNLSMPGGEIDSMDIKDLKNLISSIRELSTISGELAEGKQSGGVVILPEVRADE